MNHVIMASTIIKTNETSSDLFVNNKSSKSSSELSSPSPQKVTTTTTTTMACDSNERNNDHSKEDGGGGGGSSSSSMVVVLPPPASWLEEHFYNINNNEHPFTTDENDHPNDNNHNERIIKKDLFPCYTTSTNKKTTTTTSSVKTKDWETKRTTVETTIEVKTKKQIQYKSSTSSSSTNNNNNNNNNNNYHDDQQTSSSSSSDCNNITTTTATQQQQQQLQLQQIPQHSNNNDDFQQDEKKKSTIQKNNNNSSSNSRSQMSGQQQQQQQQQCGSSNKKIISSSSSSSFVTDDCCDKSETEEQNDESLDNNHFLISSSTPVVDTSSSDDGKIVTSTTSEVISPTTTTSHGLVVEDVLVTTNTKKNKTTTVTCWSRENLPIAAKELITSTFRRVLHHTHLSYSSTRFFGKHTLQNTDLGNNSGGYYRDALLQSGGIADDEMIQYWEGIQHLRREEQNKNDLMNGEDEWDRLRLRLPPFSSLPWVDRQLVKEWRTCEITTNTNNTYNNNNYEKPNNPNTTTTSSTDNDDDSSSSFQNDHHHSNNTTSTLLLDDDEFGDDDDDDDDETYLDLVEEDQDYSRARTMVPKPSSRPPWENASSCYECRKLFNPTLLRHHCRLCGRSYCQSHSSWNHKLPHLGYNPDVPERVCRECKSILEAQNLAERIAWRMARCRDYLVAYYHHHNNSPPTNKEENNNNNNDGNNQNNNSMSIHHSNSVVASRVCEFTPYFETGVDTVEEAALRITRAAIHMARSIPLGAQATVAVETLEVLRKHGLKGLYGLVLRKEFMAAADLLCKVTGINKRSWPLSVHELSAAIFYALAQHRAMRGMDPDREHRIHHYKLPKKEQQCHHQQQLQLQLQQQNQSEQHQQQQQRQSQLQEEDTIERSYTNDDESENEFIKENSTTELHETDRVRTLIQPANQSDEIDDDGGDTIVWGDALSVQQNHHSKSLGPSTAVIDETDIYNPMAQSVVNLLALAQEDSVKMKKKNTPLSNQNEENDLIFRNQKLKQSPSKSKHNDCQENNVPFQENKLEHEKLNFIPVCDPVSSSTLSSLIFYAPVALNFIYQKSEVDMQLLAAQQGWRLLYAHLHQDAAASGKGGEMTDKPASALFVHNEQRIACFAIRGTASINDVITDIRALPIQFPDPEMEQLSSQSMTGMNTFEQDWTPIFHGQGLALCGMARAAVNLFRENIDAIVLLACKGYRIRLTGHSLGGGVAALLGTLIRRHLDCLKNMDFTSKETASDNIMKERKLNISKILKFPDILRVYSYGSPACVDAKLSDYSQSYVTNCVLHDDVVPRLTPTSIRALLKHLLHIRETWVKAHLTDDLMAITIRAQKAWAPRWRSGFTLMSSAPSAGFKNYKKKISTKKIFMHKVVSHKPSKTPKKGKKKKKEEATLQNDENCFYSKGKHHSGTDINNYEPEKSSVMKANESARANVESHTDESKLQDDSDGQNEESTGCGTIFDGDRFFEAEESLLESDEDEDSTDYSNRTNIGNNQSTSFEDDWVPFDEPPLNAEDYKLDMKSREKSVGISCINEDNTKKSCQKNNSRLSPPVMLEETPLPRMFIPGKIVHLYTYRGGYKAAYVPRAFRDLRRISLAANMLQDHMSKSYYEALLECKTIRIAKEQLPAWTSFADETTCSCCASHFTWASTSDSEAQEARDKHNCRSCGSLVCAPCSENKFPLPSMGITTPVRICDRCYHDMGCVTNKMDDENDLTRSFISEIDEGKENRTEDDVSSGQNHLTQYELTGEPFVKKHQCARQKRSHVVDELASRLKQFI